MVGDNFKTLLPDKRMASRMMGTGGLQSMDRNLYLQTFPLRAKALTSTRTMRPNLPRFLSSFGDCTSEIQNPLWRETPHIFHPIQLLETMINDPFFFPERSGNQGC